MNSLPYRFERMLNMSFSTPGRALFSQQSASCPSRFGLISPTICHIFPQFTLKPCNSPPNSRCFRGNRCQIRRRSSFLAVLPFVPPSTANLINDVSSCVIEHFLHICTLLLEVFCPSGVSFVVSGSLHSRIAWKKEVWLDQAEQRHLFIRMIDPPT